ncbi:glycosyl transferase group 1 [Desulfovibrio sp. X2]|uniref:glycosyltransferase n=1 Tax=Desulfovibrio sp. X2 TaxID=941449 RepID=UPI000358E5F5|nr:glycosyltransferase [Desulfovibrio sp. X2]EPR37171.1 glycosyl transferase group 1 [Desulfovibrio sp. X2]
MSGIYFIVPDLRATGGGGAKFLQVLHDEFARRGLLASEPGAADVFLCNSHHAVAELARLRREFPRTPCAHRIDGPIRAYNVRHDPRHTIANLVNKYYADATIFQSLWSRASNARHGLRTGPLTAVIHNAPDPALFHPARGLIPAAEDGKMRIVSTAWSVNPQKGLSSLVWMDEHLDFARYEVTLIGNARHEFRNIRRLPLLGHSELGEELRRHHVFFFPSRVECCSNALLEGLHSGLPVLAFAGSSNPELVGEGGRMFTRDEEIPELLGDLAARLAEYRARIAVAPLAEIADAYARFLLETVPEAVRGQRLKRVGRTTRALFASRVFLARARAKLS